MSINYIICKYFYRFIIFFMSKVFKGSNPNMTRSNPRYNSSRFNSFSIYFFSSFYHCQCSCSRSSQGIHSFREYILSNHCSQRCLPITTSTRKPCSSRSFQLNIFPIPFFINKLSEKHSTTISKSWIKITKLVTCIYLCYWL